MPSRKSKGVSGASAMFGLSKLEHKKNGYGTQTVRYGRDAQIRFGWCALSLQPARNPVSTPHGVVYDREAILHYLLERKVQLRADKEEYDAQEARKAARAAEEEKGKQARQAEAMRKKLMGGIGDGDGLRSSHSGAGAGGWTIHPCL